MLEALRDLPVRIERGSALSSVVGAIGVALYAAVALEMLR